MRQLNVKTLFICLAALLLIAACADNTANVEEVALTVTGMT